MIAEAYVEPEHIVCCGHDTVVGGELYSALKSLRNSEGDRVIWIGRIFHLGLDS